MKAKPKAYFILKIWRIPVTKTVKIENTEV